METRQRRQCARACERESDSRISEDWELSETGVTGLSHAWYVYSIHENLLWFSQLEVNVMGHGNSWFQLICPQNYELCWRFISVF
uniref:Uncharacterized protein n=1 Tax=Astyanax mexicanus TaxID=7994 RepID=A0A3B1KBG0_ASTMX